MAPPRKVYTANGMSGTAEEWAAKLGTTALLFQRRIQKAGSIEAALAWYERVGNEYARRSALEYNGLKLTFNGWSKLLGIKKRTLHHRLYLGWSIENTLITPTPEQRNSGIADHHPTILAFKEARP